MSLSRDLFAAAREDAPPDVVRDEVWGRVAAATSVPAVAGTALAAKSSLLPSAGKLLALGAAVGALGAALALSLPARDGSDGGSTDTAKAAPRVRAESGHVAARIADSAPRGRAPATPPAAPEVRLPPVAEDAPAIPSTPAIVDTSDLAEEARLVTEARAALVRGDAARAYALARRTRRLSARALEPEELALEARALRALGRADEAVATELTLRRRYPNHSLSR